MTADATVSSVGEAPARRAGIVSRIPWALVVLSAVIVALVADRVYYLRSFGVVYTEFDQTMLWYQADDIAHGIVREPCYYGQAYNVPVEAWAAVPLLWCHVPHAVALPVATVGVALFPFFLLAWIAWREGKRWAASAILLIPLALPVQYIVVTSIPRGFVNGIAVGVVAVGLWTAGRSRLAFVLAGFFSVLAVTVNPNSTVMLLAAGVYALFMNLRSRRFYVYSVLGAILASPAPVLLKLFYKLHPECKIYTSQPPVEFRWSMLRETLFVGNSWKLNGHSLDLFFADFFPVAHAGWWMLLVLAALVAVPLALRKWKVAIALGATGIFVIGTLGIVRVHTALPQVFYSGSRMYLALPVVFALFALWCGEGVAAGAKWRRMAISIGGGVLLCGLIVCASVRNLSAYRPPSALLHGTWPMSIDRVKDLAADAKATAEICAKYHVSLVIPGEGFFSAFKEAGPLLSGHAFETLYPPFERRAFRIADERTRLHSAVLIYRPSLVERFYVGSVYPHNRTVSTSPPLLLIEVDKPTPGMEITEKLGYGYNAHL